MDFASSSFLISLAAIVVIDLLLAGDNAIVIALAARTVPAPLRKRAIVWGTVGAIGVRCLMTLIVVWLLSIPGLLFIGGAVLLWIAYKLLLPNGLGVSREGGNPGAKGANIAPAQQKAAPDTNFWAAMRTIVVADAVMGIDNVLGVAGAAQGSYLLVVLGLVLSIPIIAWGSGFVLRWMERFPFIVYIGAGVLAWTAASMIASEPFVSEALAHVKPHRVALFYILLVGGVLFAGLVRTQKRFEGYGLPATVGTALALLIMTLMG
jgi:YjbE family integral membrane protein